jgi:hypothetical protein
MPGKQMLTWNLVEGHLISEVDRLSFAPRRTSARGLQRTRDEVGGMPSDGSVAPEPPFVLWVELELSFERNGGDQSGRTKVLKSSLSRQSTMLGRVAPIKCAARPAGGHQMQVRFKLEKETRKRCAALPKAR